MIRRALCDGQVSARHQSNRANVGEAPLRRPSGSTRVSRQWSAPTEHRCARRSSFRLEGWSAKTLNFSFSVLPMVSPARHRGKEERKPSAQGNDYFAEDVVAVATGSSWPIGNVTMGRSEGQRDRSFASASGDVAK